MHVSAAAPRPAHSKITFAASAFLALVTAIFVALIAAGGFVLSMRLIYADRALPGVTVASIEVSGMSRAEVEAALGTALTYPRLGTIAFQDGERLWEATPADLGVVLDIPTMAQQAMSVGRAGGLVQQIGEQIDVWYRGTSIAPRLIVDQRAARAFLEGLAQEIDRPMQEASLVLSGTLVQSQPGQIGRELDIQATLDTLTPDLARMHNVFLPLIVRESHPLVLDVSEQASIAQTILSQPLVITSDKAGPWTFDQETLASMLTIKLVSDGGATQYRIGLDTEQIEATLEPLAPDFEIEPKNARFIFNDETRELDLLEPAVIGRSLDIAATIASIDIGLARGEHTFPVLFEEQLPAVGNDVTAADLGISEEVSVVTSYFRGSSSARVSNIRIASASFHGLLIPPGATLSMAEVLGKVSLNNGYAEALIIYGGRTIKGVGGGVCQVSTTLFRTAFLGGYQIDERHPHAYRVGYYEQGPGSPGPGLDATVFVPRVDFKFTNDTAYWLLMETYVYKNRLVWKFYSTSDGRTVKWTSSGPKKVVPAPEPLYRENPELAAGKIRQVDWEADGMDVVIRRAVSRQGETLFNDVFKTRYLPWRAIYEYGPGTELPEGALTE